MLLRYFKQIKSKVRKLLIPMLEVTYCEKITSTSTFLFEIITFYLHCLKNTNFSILKVLKVPT